MDFHHSTNVLVWVIFLELFTMLLCFYYFFNFFCFLRNLFWISFLFLFLLLF